MLQRWANRKLDVAIFTNFVSVVNRKIYRFLPIALYRTMSKMRNLVNKAI